jgi:hypothetical protein
MANSERPRYFRGVFRAYLITFALTAVMVLCSPHFRPRSGLSVAGFAGALTGYIVGYSVIPVLVGTVAGLVWVIFLKRPFTKTYLVVSTGMLLILWLSRLINMLEGNL